MLLEVELIETGSSIGAVGVRRGAEAEAESEVEATFEAARGGGDVDSSSFKFVNEDASISAVTVLRFRSEIAAKI